MFSLPAVQTAFHDSLIQDEDVAIRHYVLAYQELCKFCSQLGTLFGFVVNDLQDKIGRLNMLLEDDELHFSTVQNMILHETSNNLLKENSGCITMLRLHRGLEFIILFMSKLVNLQPNESTIHSAQDAYKKTLAKHHSWLIRNGAYLAMNFLPNQGTLYRQTVGDGVSVGDTLDAMLEMISEASVVHNRVRTLFLNNDILNLP